MNEIKPCTHCSGEGRRTQDFFDRFFVICNNCGAGVFSLKSQDEADQKWNARIENGVAVNQREVEGVLDKTWPGFREMKTYYPAIVDAIVAHFGSAPDNGKGKS